MSFENKIKKFNRHPTIRIALALSIALLAIGTVSVGLSSQFAMAQGQSNSSAITAKKPIDGYSTPQGHLSAIRHVFDDPALRVQHYCKPSDKIVLVCQLYDSISPNATLIGVEYIITADQYKSIPDRDKPNWHYHAIEFATKRADPLFPELKPVEIKAVTGKLMDTYGKVIITWDPKDKLPVFPAQVEQVQHPFMVNQTITSPMETHVGSFNQTLKY